MRVQVFSVSSSTGMVKDKTDGDSRHSLDSDELRDVMNELSEYIFGSGRRQRAAIQSGDYPAATG